jgi:hypothetical protein
MRSIREPVRHGGTDRRVAIGALRTAGAVDSEEMCCVYKCSTPEMNLHGKCTPVSDIGSVATSTEYQREDYIRRFLRHVLEEYRDNGIAGIEADAGDHITTALQQSLMKSDRQIEMCPSPSIGVCPVPNGLKRSLRPRLDGVLCRNF